MKVTGFTIIKNAVKMDYPVVEAITSILSICDGFIVSIGDCDDGTLELIQSIPSDKIRILRSEWNEKENIGKGEHILAIETNKALKEISKDTDWAFYIQSDEVVHEDYLSTIKEEMTKYKDNNKVECLVFKYKHFYGSYDYIGASLNWYRREIRAFKPLPNIYSYKDAQGFRKDNNKKLKGKLVNAYIYHYGWVRPPEVMQKKQNSFVRLYRHFDDDPIKNFAYEDNVEALYLFTETHPIVMQERIKHKNWSFGFDVSYNKFSLKDKFKSFIEKITGWRIGEFRNYKLV